ncbi:helix-turn-helix domain-containing protein [Novosphingobium sp.]|uniref:AraC family transcriptional regulator n=1 Tax=Novosphingobium sp. TaxID=1874826 RepID=UPI0035AD9EB3
MPDATTQTRQPRVERELTPPSLLRLQHYPAPPALQPYITTLFTLRCMEREIRDMLPAAVGYLAIVIAGNGTMRFADGRTDQAHPETLLAPTNAAVELKVDGPLDMLAAALSPLGWATLTKLDASRHVDRADDADALLGDGIHDLGIRIRRLAAEGQTSDADLAMLLAEHIGARLGPLNPQHVRLIGQVADWMSDRIDPQLPELLARTGYSPRQLERLVARYFGSTPKQLARKYRALRVVALLQSAETSDEKAAGLVNLFYDQSHMIREVRRFVGRTPQRLAAADESVLQSAIALRNYREFRPNIARIPDD